MRKKEPKVGNKTGSIKRKAKGKRGRRVRKKIEKDSLKFGFSACISS